MMCRSAENNKSMAHIIPVTSKCTASISPAQCFCLSLHAEELLPHSSRLMMLPGLLSFTEGTCPLGGVGGSG